MIPAYHAIASFRGISAGGEQGVAQRAVAPVLPGSTDSTTGAPTDAPTLRNAFVGVLNMRRFVSAHVERLLGQYRHDVYLRPGNDFVIIYGPNGIGKTKLLELIRAAIDLDYRSLVALPFSEATIKFSDGAVRLRKETPVEEHGQPGTSGLALQLFDNRDRVVDEWVIHEQLFATDFEHYLSRETPWRQISPDVWEDMSDGEVVPMHVLRGRFPSFADDQTAVLEPEGFRQFFADLSVHLISTQRLSTERVGPRTRGPRRERSTVLEYASDLERRLGAALAANSRTTQNLDRTFPRRLLLDPAGPQISDNAIRERYNEQNSLRRQLASISLIGSEADLPLPERRLEDWERKVLWTYLDDTEQKLATFQEILDKVTLLGDILNAKFLRKTLTFDIEQGIEVRRQMDGQPIPLDRLSSGEQHELILIYDLLFNVRPGSLVLVDEPEISLHVAWQQRFLTDIQRISELVPTSFIVATHSPQIINKWWDQTIELSALEV